MTTTIIANGELKLILCPTTEIEKLLLQSLFSGPIQAAAHATMQVAGKNMVDVIEITTVTKPTVAV